MWRFMKYIMEVMFLMVGLTFGLGAIADRSQEDGNNYTLICMTCLAVIAIIKIIV